MPVGTYKTEDGVSFTVEEEGIVGEVSESESEEEEVEEEVDATEVEAEEVETADDGMEKRIQNLEDAVADLKSALGKDEDEDEECPNGKDDEGNCIEDEAEEMEVIEPGTNPKTITTKEVKEFSSEDFSALVEENERLKDELGKVPGDNPIKAEKFSNDTTRKLSKNQRANLSSSDRFLYDLNN